MPRVVSGGRPTLVAYISKVKFFCLYIAVCQLDYRNVLRTSNTKHNSQQMRSDSPMKEALQGHLFLLHLPFQI